MKQSSTASKHPAGLSVLFFSEMWERFSYYGLRALLVLYMIKHLGYLDKRAYAVYGAYFALVYATPVVGGILADRVLGQRYSVILGGILMSIGHFFMAIPSEPFFYLALAFVCVGCGFFKPNISTMVGQLYEQGDSRRDSAFTIFYMGINLGAFFAPLVIGIVGERYGWHYGFSIAGIGMLLGLWTFKSKESTLGDAGLPPNNGNIKRVVAGFTMHQWIYVLSFLATPILAYALYQVTVFSNLLNIVGVAMISYLVYEAIKFGGVARDRIFLVILLMFFHTTFWALFEQAGSSLTVFADRNVSRSLLGWIMPASVTQAYNPFFILTFGALFAWLWKYLGQKNKDISIPHKFVLGLVGVSTGFYALVFGAKFAGLDVQSGLQAQTGMIWLILAYLFHTLGELFISPIGLSAVTKLAPAKLGSTMMGAWFLSISFGNHIAAAIAGLTGSNESGVDASKLAPAETLTIYTGVFMQVFWTAMAIAVLLIIITPFLKKLAHGVK